MGSPALRPGRQVLRGGALMFQVSWSALHPILSVPSHMPPSSLKSLLANSKGHWCVLKQDSLFSRAALPEVTSLVAQMVRNLPAVQETQVQSLGQFQSPGEGHGNPLQYSGPKNPMNHGVTKSWTRLSDQHTLFFARRLPLLVVFRKDQLWFIFPFYTFFPLIHSFVFQTLFILAPWFI